MLLLVPSYCSALGHCGSLGSTDFNASWNWPVTPTHQTRYSKPLVTRNPQLYPSLDERFFSSLAFPNPSSLGRDPTPGLGRRETFAPGVSSRPCRNPRVQLR